MRRSRFPLDHRQPSGIQTPQPPGDPVIWYNANNIDGLYNSTLLDGQAIVSWHNSGSIGGSATISTGKTYKKIDTNGHSSVFFSGSNGGVSQAALVADDYVVGILAYNGAAFVSGSYWMNKSKYIRINTTSSTFYSNTSPLSSVGYIGDNDIHAVASRHDGTNLTLSDESQTIITLESSLITSFSFFSPNKSLPSCIGNMFEALIVPASTGADVPDMVAYLAQVVGGGLPKAP